MEIPGCVYILLLLVEGIAARSVLPKRQEINGSSQSACNNYNDAGSRWQCLLQQRQASETGLGDNVPTIAQRGGWVADENHTCPSPPRVFDGGVHETSNNMVLTAVFVAEGTTKYECRMRKIMTRQVLFDGASPDFTMARVSSEAKLYNVGKNLKRLKALKTLNEDTRKKTQLLRLSTAGLEEVGTFTESELKGPRRGSSLTKPTLISTLKDGKPWPAFRGAPLEEVASPGQGRDLPWARLISSGTPDMVVLRVFTRGGAAPAKCDDARRPVAYYSELWVYEPISRPSSFGKERFCDPPLSSKIIL